MNINLNNQLLLRFDDTSIKGLSLQIKEDFYKTSGYNFRDFNDVLKLMYKPENKTKTFYICETVYEVSKMIRITENFDFNIFKTIKQGTYNYLMGNDKMLKFVVINNNIYFIYIDYKCDHRLMFEFDFENNDKNLSNEQYNILVKILQIIVFIEFGDINVYTLPPGKKNNSTQLSKQIKNSSINNIIVVNSRYNTIVIRNEEFGVRGHFRIQPCGPNKQETKLIWIDSFKKSGYIRGAESLKTK